MDFGAIKQSDFGEGVPASTNGFLRFAGMTSLVGMMSISCPLDNRLAPKHSLECPRLYASQALKLRRKEVVQKHVRRH